MYCSKIATKVQHFMRNSLKEHSFFILEGEARDALELVGELYLNEHDMHYFADWLAEGEPDKADPYTLLVSLDGKSGLVRRWSEITGWSENSTIVTFMAVGDVVQGRISELKYALEVQLHFNSDLAAQIDFKRAPKAIPKRLTWAHRNTERDMFSMLRRAKKNPFDATNDALVWLLVIGSTADGDLTPLEVSGARLEIQKRIAWNFGSGAEFFANEGLTIEEINSRHNRAVHNFKRFNKRFNGKDLKEAEVLDFLSHLDTDALAELVIHMLGNNLIPENCENTMLSELQRRYPGGWIRDNVGS
jgi:hypothetical protein